MTKAHELEPGTFYVRDGQSPTILYLVLAPAFGEGGRAARVLHDATVFHDLRPRASRVRADMPVLVLEDAEVTAWFAATRERLRARTSARHRAFMGWSPVDPDSYRGSDAPIPGWPETKASA